jgi:hypothetical protein
MAAQCLSCYPVGLISKVARLLAPVVIVPASSINQMALRRANKLPWNTVSWMITNHICACCHPSTYKKISALSFYPGHGDNNHPLACLDHGNLPFHTPLVNDDSTKTEDLDSVDDTAALSLKHPSKFSESLAVEVS